MRKPKTAAELLAKLHADPGWVEAKAQREAMQRARSARLEVEEAHLLADLRASGWDINSIWDFVNMHEPYPTAVPVLLKHLSRDYSDWTKNGIARALAVPEAAYAWHEIVAAWKAAEAGSEAKDGLAIAVARAAPSGALPRLIAFAQDKSLGSSRIFLLRALMRSRSPAALEAIERLADDPHLKQEIADWKKRQRKKTC
jgi:hypothetical protein